MDHKNVMPKEGREDRCVLAIGRRHSVDLVSFKKEETKTQKEAQVTCFERSHHDRQRSSSWQQAHTIAWLSQRSASLVLREVSDGHKKEEKREDDCARE